jgi:hypothetical protein
MARKKSTRTIDVTNKSNLPAKVIKASPAVFVPPPETNEATIEAPTEALEGYELEDAPGGLVDTVDFPQIGAFVFGEYRGVRSLSIGGRIQMLYDLSVDGKAVSLWGSTILDQRFMRLNPQLGEMIYIQYCGDVETKRGLNPAKNFRVARMKPKEDGK